MRRPARSALAAAALCLALAACGSSTAGPASPTGGRVLRIVAAENFWGSIASQIGGKQVAVTNIIDNPAADPHDYEPTPADARTSPKTIPAA